MHTPRLLALATISSLLLTVSAHAGVFPDVPDTHQYREAIEYLVGKGVIGGNPDGTFRPNDPVNRAALLKMLYKATGMDAVSHTPGCFTDIQRGSWYEPFVCNAFAKGFVQGYKDKSFRPDTGVSRVETLKLLTLFFDIPTPPISQDDRKLVNFTDLSTSEWYAVYVYAAFREGILPIAGMTGPMFEPARTLTRGEAAVYIYNALRLKEKEEQASSSSVSSSRSSSSSSSSTANVIIIAPKIPFADTQTFSKKDPINYRFSLTTKTVIGSIASLGAGEQGSLTCRLYKLTDDGFSLEYYLGFSEGSTCYLRAALAPGNYQLQLQPTVQGTRFTIDVQETTGDGNDGFSEAKKLEKNVLRTDALEGGDYDDWYTFTVKAEDEYTIELRSTDQLRCLIYPMADVDIFGFSGPSCNTPYTFPTGTYYVGVGHGQPRAAKQTYSIRLK